VREQEDKASQDLIKKILEEEQELQLKQERADQQLARKLSGDFEQTQVLYGLLFNINSFFSMFKIVDTAMVMPDLDLDY
jgi:hypothetical protein